MLEGELKMTNAKILNTVEMMQALLDGKEITRFSSKGEYDENKIRFRIVGDSISDQYGNCGVFYSMSCLDWVIYEAPKLKYTLTNAIEHLVKESGSIKRITEKGEKHWYMSGEEIKCYFIFAPGQFRIPFSCFDEDDLVAENYELIYNY